MDIKGPSKDERIAFHIRGVKIVLVAAILGIIAGALSSPLFLSQPVYTPILKNGVPAFQGDSVIMLANAAVLRPNVSAGVSGEPFFIPDASVMLKNASVAVANASSLIPGAIVTHTNAIITPGNGSVVNDDKSIVLNNVSVALTDSSSVPAEASVLLTRGVVIMPGTSDGQSDASVLLSSKTSMQSNPHAPNHTSFAFLILALCIYVQKYLLPPIGIDTSRHGIKDWFFVAFLTFCFWFMTWTIILNGPVPFGPFF